MSRSSPQTCLSLPWLDPPPLRVTPKAALQTLKPVRGRDAAGHRSCFYLPNTSTVLWQLFTSYKSSKSLTTNLSGNCLHEQLTVITPLLSAFTCLNNMQHVFKLLNPKIVTHLKEQNRCIHFKTISFNYANTVCTVFNSTA